MESGHACPICLKEFNPEIEERIPYRFCEESHFLCQKCIRSCIASQASPEVIRVSDADQNFRGIKVECSECVQVHCPVCRCSILPASQYGLINKAIFKFSRDRIFDQMISSKSSTEPSLAMEERRKVKKSIKKSMTTMESAFGPMIEQFKKLQEDYSSLISTQEESVSEYETDIEKKIEHTAFLKAEIQKLKDEIKGLESKKPLLMSEYKRQALSDGKLQIDQIVNDYRQEIESKLQKEETQMREKHSETIKLLEEKYHHEIEEIETYKFSLRYQKKEILDTFIQENSSEAQILTDKKLKLETEIKDYEIHISQLCSDADYILKTAMKKHGFDPDYLSHEQKKYEREAARLRTMLIEEAKQDAEAEKDKMRKEVYETKQKIAQQLRDWGTNRKEFQRFLNLKKALGERKAEIAFSPLSGGNQEEVETKFWKILAEYEKIPNPTYKLSEYHLWKEQKKRTGNIVDDFLMKQRMIYGFN